VVSVSESHEPVYILGFVVRALRPGPGQGSHRAPDNVAEPR